MEKVKIPLVSFCITTYNHEQYIEDCLLAAIKQDYTGEMEIVISDDCSTDKTWDKIQNIIEEFPNINIIANRNKTNLGIAKNTEKLWSLSRGEIIVTQDSDDISLPNRVSTLVNYYESYPDVVLIDSGYNFIVDNNFYQGKIFEGVQIFDIDRFFSKKRMETDGYRSYRRNVITSYKQFFASTPTADSTTLLRGILIGKIMRIPDLLANYRLHPNQVSNANNIKKINRSLIAKQYRADVFHAIKQHYFSRKYIFKVLVFVYRYSLIASLNQSEIYIRYIKPLIKHIK